MAALAAAEYPPPPSPPGPPGPPSGPVPPSPAVPPCPLVSPSVPTPADKKMYSHVKLVVWFNIVDLLLVIKLKLLRAIQKK